MNVYIGLGIILGLLLTYLMINNKNKSKDKMKVKLLKKCRKYIQIDKNIDLIFKYRVVSYFNGYPLTCICTTKKEAQNLLRIHRIKFAYWYKLKN